MARTPAIIKLPDEYANALKLGPPTFSTIFQFENGLRILVNNYLVTLYGQDWWEQSLKIRMRPIYDYVEDQKNKRSFMPWIGDSPSVQLLPLHSITLGHLEQIVIHYRSDCVPELFPTLDFFTGHLLVIKKVRNLFAHMYPCVDKQDLQTLKREVKTLTEHIEVKIRQYPSIIP